MTPWLQGVGNMRIFCNKKGTMRAILYSVPTGIAAVFILGRLYTIQDRTHLEETVKEKQAVEETLKDITLQKDKLQEQLNTIKPKLDEAMSSDVFNLKAELASLYKSLAEKEEMLQAVRKETGAAQLSAYQARKELDGAKERLAELRQRLVNNEKFKSESGTGAQGLREEITSQIGRLEKEKLSLQELLDKSQAQLSSQVALSVTTQDRIVSLVRSLKQKDEEYAAIKKRLEEAVKNQLLLKREADEVVKNKDLELGRKNEQLIALKDSMDSLSKEKSNIEAQLTETNERLKRLSDEKALVESRLISLNQLFKDSEIKQEALKAELDGMKAETVKLKDELISAKKRQQETNEQLIQVVNINSSLQKKLVDISVSLGMETAPSLSQNIYPEINNPVDPDKDEALELGKKLQDMLNIEEPLGLER